MRICLCTLVLNEMQWLPDLYKQHKDWLGLIRWIFVESADQVYAEANPTLVSSEGLSTDGTTDYLERLSLADNRIIHIKHGFCSSEDKAQGKCEARNRYLREMDVVAPDYFIVVDADEFYPYESQNQVNSILDRTSTRREIRRQDRAWAVCLKHREIWRPPFFQERPELHKFSYEVVGGFWSIPYCRIWRWFPNLQYFNHNTPSLNGGCSLDKYMIRLDSDSDAPYFVHMGFAAKLEYRAAKNRYYEQRGEAVDRKRSWYCDSRRAFETWTPNTVLPNKAKVIPYTGLVPECFQ